MPTARTRPPRPASAPRPAPATTAQRHVAVIGAGMAGVVCARTLLQAGHRVTLLEKSHGCGGRMATRPTEFGGFDHGAQYFTVRDARFALALQTVPETVRPWSANTVQVLDAQGHRMASAPPAREPHFVARPGMSALVKAWAAPLQSGAPAAQVLTERRVVRIEPDALQSGAWQLRTEGPDGALQVIGGLDRVVMAIPHPQALDLLQESHLAPDWRAALQSVSVAPCWTLMLAFPQAMQPGLGALGPQWNAARSEHHRIAWLARESSKPGREPIERWTVQASPAWSTEHLEDDAERVKAKLLKGFTEITGIRATPTHAVVHRWRYAQTQQPLGRSHLWNAQSGLGVCGDWCLGHRVEDAFVSGLELALAMCD